MLKEMPKKGDVIRYIEECVFVDYLTRGEKYIVRGEHPDGIAFIHDDDGERYYILEACEFDEFELVADKEDEILHRLSKLAETVAQISREVDGIKKDVQTFGDDTENLLHDLGQALADASITNARLDAIEHRQKEAGDYIEMLVDDVVMLDERTRAKAEAVVDERAAESEPSKGGQAHTKDAHFAQALERARRGEY